MNQEFREAVESLHPKFESLIHQAPYPAGGSLPMQGVYLFCENGKALYVGRSNNIPQRRRNHTQRSSATNQAALATLIARRETGRLVDYRKGARERRQRDEEFMNAFEQAKHRVRNMQFRAVEERDQTRQVLLEVYCAIALKTPYNDFGTH
jgi:predicted GIY-YIG superfamily endonuclease